MELAEKGVSASDIAKAQGVACPQSRAFWRRRARGQGPGRVQGTPRRLAPCPFQARGGTSLAAPGLPGWRKIWKDKPSRAQGTDRVIGTLFGISQDKVAQLENKLLGGLRCKSSSTPLGKPLKGRACCGGCIGHHRGAITTRRHLAVRCRRGPGAPNHAHVALGLEHLGVPWVPPTRLKKNRYLDTYR
jgi:hypothetical protein